MLEVGVTGQNGKSEGGLTFLEQRTHFGLWRGPLPRPSIHTAAAASRMMS